jgi:hypothetical protein
MSRYNLNKNSPNCKNRINNNIFKFIFLRKLYSVNDYVEKYRREFLADKKLAEDAI